MYILNIKTGQVHSIGHFTITVYSFLSYDSCFNS